MVFSAMVILVWGSINGQQLPDKKRTADKLYKAGNYALAIPLYKSLINGLDINNPNVPVENIYILADCYRLIKSYTDAEYWFQITAKNYNCPNIAHFYFGESLQHEGKYQEAKEQFNLFVTSSPEDASLKSSKIESCNKSLKLKNLSSPYVVKNVKELNSSLSDFGLIQSHNDFYFVSNRPITAAAGLGKLKDSLYGWTNQPYWHLYRAQLVKEKGFVNPEILNKTINSKYHTGPAALNIHGDVMFFTQANAQKRHEDKSGNGVSFKESVNNNQILVSIKLDGEWQKPIPCYFNDANTYSVEHPALSKDEKQLYFASDMPGGKGGLDLYSVEILGGGMYGQPKNLGDSVNSAGDEVFPTIAPDGSLYYSSNGKIGYGGLDIFHTSFENNHWKTPINLNKPINSNKDDFFLVYTDQDKNQGYFSSNRDGGLGEDDIYSFQGFFPKPKVDSTKSSAYLFLKKTNPKILDSIVRFFKSDTQKGWVGKNLTLQCIQYQIGKAEIKKTSLPILNEIAEILNKNTFQRLLIKGFTDNLGTPSKNLLLSAARSNNIRDYLISRGVDPNRLVAKGFGSFVPIFKCPEGLPCTEKQNEANRRTEFTLIL